MVVNSTSSCRVNGDLHWHSGQKCPPPPQHSQPRKIRQINKVQYVTLLADMQANMGTICHQSRLCPQLFPDISQKLTLSTPALGQFFFFVQKNNCTQLIFICALNMRNTVPIETHLFLLWHYTTFSVTLFQVAMQVAEGWLQNKTTLSAHTHTHYKSYLRSYVPICTTLIIFFPILEATESTYPH